MSKLPALKHPALFVSNKESFSFVNPTTFTTLRFQQRTLFSTFTTLSSQQCCCAFSFHSLALCRHSYVILNAPSAPAGDFFFSIKTSAQRSPNGKDSQGDIVREVGQCKFTGKKLTQDVYDAERENSVGPDDIFMLYTDAEISGDFTLPDRSGLVDASCWGSYFDPFSGRAYMALRHAVPEDVTKYGRGGTAGQVIGG